MTLEIVWFLLIAVLFVGYAVLDGFDLGVGVLHLTARDEHERRVHINAIGPVWDGNEVWLITAGGALFAAFPVVYATVFSGFYIALMLLLFALIFRAVAMEFRGKVDAPGWKRVWDFSFGVGSLLIALLLGVALGNILRGVPLARLDGETVFGGSFLDLLNPYALLVGVLVVVLLVVHGAAYLTLKTEGELEARVWRWVIPGWAVFVVLYVATVIASAVVAPSLFEGKLGSPILWALAALTLAGIVATPLAARRRKALLTFLATSATIAGALGLAAVGLFPRLVPALGDPTLSLTLSNAASSERTLSAMLVIALIGMPLVVVYTALMYRAFKGKVRIGKDSY